MSLSEIVLIKHDLTAHGIESNTFGDAKKIRYS